MPTINLTSANDTYSIENYDDGLYTVNGKGGDDTLNGNWDDDTLNGNDDNDVIQGFDGNDVLNGGAGNDALYAGAKEEGTTEFTGEDIIHGNAGDDTIVGSTSQEADGQFYGDGGADKIMANARGGYYFIDAGTGNDSIQTGQTDSHGDFDAFGDAGNDTISGVGGTNYFAGGDGNDALHGAFGTFYLDGEDGNDVMDLGSFSSGTLDGGLGDDTLTGVAQRDQFVMFGGEGNDYLEGYGNFSDINEEYHGDQGDDTIKSLGGSDTLSGGDGNDSMTGGDGNDIFLFEDRDMSYEDTSAFTDKVTDFSTSTDVIHFAGMGLTYSDLAIADQSDGAHITYHDNAATDNVIVLAGVLASSVTATNFDFA
jgi:Ca2+-binding RTX toxin-like protein